MPFADKPSGWVNDHLSTISILPGIDPFASFPFFAKSKCLISDELIGAETVVKFNYIDIFGSNSSLLESFLSSLL